MRQSATTITEIGMLLYWVLAGALCLKLVSIDPSLMYSDHLNPLMIAWNWSFFPIDAAFAITGLAARYAAMRDDLRVKLETTSSVLMICAGAMAISFWVLTGDFSVTWWAMNIWLVVLGCFNLFCGQPTGLKPV